MKKAAISLLTCVVLAGTSFAGTVASGKGYKDYKAPAPVSCFGDTELQVDVFGTYNESRYVGYEDGFGGGLGLNYFFHRYIGVGVDGTIYDGGVNGAWAFSGSLIARLPIDCACLAPYVLGGGGYAVDGTSYGTWHAGGGLEYRIVPNQVGIFGEGRYVWGADNNDNIQARLGVRIVF